VATYPKEDTGQRALAARKALGGHCGVAARVLAQLTGPLTYVSLVGTVPTLEDPDSASTIATLKAEGVDTSLLEEVGGNALPTSFILGSQDTGTRTIISTRHGVRELAVAHVEAAVSRAFSEEKDLGRPCWCHLECRQDPEVVLQMAKVWRATAPSDAAARLSLEVARPSVNPEALTPLFLMCDYAFFSQEFIEAYRADLLQGSTQAPEVVEKQGMDWDWHQHVALRCLRALSARVGSARAVWVCTWGKTGSFALDSSTGREFYEPAVAVNKVVESAHAGDTFVAAFVHSTARGAGVGSALHISSAVAGHKVAQVGFSGLGNALRNVEYQQEDEEAA